MFTHITKINIFTLHPTKRRGILLIKIYLQDGSKDLDNEFGNWWLANQQMVAALNYKAYDYMFVKGTGGHNGKHAGSVFPEALKWLWSE